MKKVINLITCLLFILYSFCQNTPYLLIGTYTSGKSEGIYVYKFNSQTGDFTFVSKAAAGNPSYLAVSPDKRFVYAVNEDANDKGSVAAYSFDKSNGTLTFLDKQSSGGDHPCYVAVDKTGKWVTTGNYTAGSLSIMPVMVNGTLGTPSTIQHKGEGPDKKRQEKPHVHCTFFSPDNNFLFVPDLGIDKVMTYAFNPGSGKLMPAATPFTQTEPGTGPRHITFHPSGKFAYLVEELTGTVSAYSYKDGKLTFLQRISSLPADYTGPKSGADIHVSPGGDFLYSSNRGESNTIAIYAIERKSGKLKVLGHQSTMGKTPRNFNFDPSGNYLLAANQNSDEITIFERNKKTGMLKDTGKRIAVGNPVCVKWIE
jgi:6-phosphogluconolactonase